jgi:aminoglycoside phosphotransferase (APT) family kinase protein
MLQTRMHPDEIHTDADLVRRLLTGQFPQWAGLPVKRFPSSGTDNALYRLGSELVVRLPRIHWAAGGVAKDSDWLDRLRALVPVEIPELLGVGVPAEGYEWEWGVYRWLPGENPAAGTVSGSELAQFVAAVREIGLGDAPKASRSDPLAHGDEQTRERIEECEGLADTAGMAAVWAEAVGAPEWPGPPVWIHGDLTPLNLLHRSGRLAAVIDWTGAGLGDPAFDVKAAWTCLDATQRAEFRSELAVDDDTWLRSKGWAITTAANILPYYRDTNPGLAENARYRIEQVLADR